VLSIEEISDRLEIQDLLIAYSTAIDTRRFDDLDRVFTPDAYIDYRAMGGVDGRYPEVKAWLAQVLPNFPAYAHMLGNVDIRLAGDTATSRTLCFNPMVLGAARRRHRTPEPPRRRHRTPEPPRRRHRTPVGSNPRSCSAGSGTRTSSCAPETAGG
jgi:hypothetical protein